MRFKYDGFFSQSSYGFGLGIIFFPRTGDYAHMLLFEGRIFNFMWDFSILFGKSDGR